MTSKLAAAVSTGNVAALRQLVSTYGTAAPETPAVPWAGPVAPIDAATISPDVHYDRGVLTLSGKASSTAGVSSVEISAEVDDTATDLGAATLNVDGTFSFQDVIGAHVQGFITPVETDAGGGTATSLAGYSLQGGLGSSGRAGQQVQYSDDGDAVTARTTFWPNGSRKVDIGSSDQTLHASSFDTFVNHGAPQTTFMFDPGYGLDVIYQFPANGSDHDTLYLPASDFTSFADVLQNTHKATGGVQITDPVSGDTIKLAGLSKKELFANKQDFAFHS